jgi:hypothetical protein
MQHVQNNLDLLNCVWFADSHPEEADERVCSLEFADMPKLPIDKMARS